MKGENVLTQLRERPEEERMAIAMGAALAVGALLFLLWGLTFFISNSTGSAPIAEVDQQASVVESFDSLKRELETTSVQFQTQYEQLKRALEEGGLVPEEAEKASPVVELSVGDDGEVLVDEILVDSNGDVIE